MINRQDMIDRFGEFELAELTDRDSHQEIDDVVLNRAIDDGVAEASSYLLPVGLADITPPYSLKIRVCDIARYYLYEEGMITEVVKDRYERAIAWLKMVRKDPAMLTGNETAVKASQSVKVIPMVRR